ncbi:MAG: DF family (seleno)protein [Solirubrobacteraceae bacterium]
MLVELLFWEGCPSHPRALADLRAAMVELGLDPSGVVLREVSTDSDAVGERFVGSPTIRIDGVDIQPVENEPYGLTCRIYHRRGGRISPTPDPTDVHEALATAIVNDTERK